MTVRTRPVQWISPYVPDEKRRTLIGEIIVRHVHLDHMLKMTIKSLLGISVDDALSRLVRKGSAGLRCKITEEAARRLGKGEDLQRLTGLIDECRETSTRRNRIAKDLYAVHLSEPKVGQVTQLGDDLHWYNPPPVEELKQLISDLQSLTEELNDARLNGWLKEAIERVGQPKGQSDAEDAAKCTGR